MTLEPDGNAVQADSLLIMIGTAGKVSTQIDESILLLEGRKPNVLFLTIGFRDQRISWLGTFQR